MSDDLLQFIALPPLSPDLESTAQEIVTSAVNIALSQPPSDNLVFIHTAGIPTCGKSSYVEDYERRAYLQNVYFNIVEFDRIMAQLPGYQTDMRYDRVAAFKKWEMPARIIGYRVLNALTVAGTNVLFEHSGANRGHIDMLRFCREQRGYFVEMHHIQCSLETGLKRVRRRNARGGRYTPESYLVERHAMLEELMPLYMGVVNRYQPINGTTDRLSVSVQAGRAITEHRVAMLQRSDAPLFSKLEPQKRDCG